MAFVLDASATAGLFLDDEAPPHSVIAQFSRGETAIVPGLFILEVLNLLVKAVRRSRLTAGDVHIQLERLARLPVDVESGSADSAAVLILALRHSLSAYDACYLELAMSNSVPLATNDRALAAAARAEGVTVV